MAEHAQNPWVQTFRGQQFHPLAPAAHEINIADIAHSLSLLCRFDALPVARVTGDGRKKP